MKKIFPRSRRLATSIAVALATLSVGSAYAAGLGRLTVQSALGQPLRAEVEVTSLSNQESQSLSVRLASPDAFKQAGLEYGSALGGMRFAVDRRPDGRATVKISSAQPLNEPFIDLLIELNWSTGKFVREYTFLLDPPELKMAQSQGQDAAQAVVPPVAAPAAAAPMPAPAPAPAAAAPAPAPAMPPPAATVTSPAAAVATPAAEPVARATPAPRPTAPTPVPPPSTASNTSSGPSGDVSVKAGETLATIAGRVKPANVSMDQAIVAIYRANPSAFFGSVNQLRTGASLSIPDASTMNSIDAGAARAEVRAQMANFNQYKARLAANSRSVETGRAGQSASGSVSGSVTDRSGPANDADQLKLSKSAAQSKGNGNSVAGSDAERKVASDSATREAQSRVVELEKNVADLRRLLELKDKQLADMQSAAKAAKAAPPAASGTVGATGAAAAAAAAAAATASKTPPAAPATPPVATVSPPVAEAPKAATPPAAATPPVAIPAPTPAPTAAPVAEAPKEPTPPVEAKSEPKVEPVASAAGSESSLIDDLTDNPLVLPGIAAIIALIAGTAWVAIRRRKKVEKFEDSLIAPDGFAANSLFGSTGGQTGVDTHNSLFTASRETTSDVHSTEVDPIAEAEVYIAYGREAQAEEILKEALKKQPERQAIRLKLLEIYAGRKDAKTFGAMAGEMYDMTGGQNEEWPKVVTLGLSIDPDNALYTGKGSGEPSAYDGGESAFAQPAGADSHDDHATTFTDVPDAPGSQTHHSGAMMAGVSAAAAASLAARDKAEQDAAMTARAKPSVNSDDEVPALDFDLDLDHALSRANDDLGREDRRGSSELAQAVEGKFDLPSLDLPTTSGGAAIQHEPSFAGSAVAELNDDLKIDLPALEGLDTKMRRPVESAPVGGAAMDLSAIGLDLQPSTMAPPPNADAARWQEMATKLDLASAYEEIGDNEGARELLQEVLKGGDGDQQQRAQMMLSKIN